MALLKKIGNKQINALMHVYMYVWRGTSTILPVMNMRMLMVRLLRYQTTGIPKSKNRCVSPTSCNPLVRVVLCGPSHTPGFSRWSSPCIFPSPSVALKRRCLYYRILLFSFSSFLVSSASSPVFSPEPPLCSTCGWSNVQRPMPLVFRYLARAPAPMLV